MAGDAKLTDYLHYYKALKAFLSSEKAGDVFGVGKEKFKREIANTGQIVRKIDRALKSLNATERQIIIKRDIEGKRWAEVAWEMAYCERHCKSLRARALKKIENEFTNAVKRGP